VYPYPVSEKSPPDLDILRDWLRQPLPVTHVNRVKFHAGHLMEQEVVTTNRLILVVRGELDYRVEHTRRRLSAGTQFLVSAWTRRVWTAARGRECEIIWCEFEDQREGPTPDICPRRRLDKSSLALELATYRRLQRLWRPAPLPPDRQLLLEAELKTLLARFWLGREATTPSATPSALPHPRVQACLRWLNANLQKPDALEEMYATSGLTKNYLRELFQTAMGCSPSQHLQRLRLRHARYLLWQTRQPVKAVAYEVGYTDPLYFSRLYTRFWGRNPASERAR
jgi:AraC-like DNA-binding protein